jgi:hypothetical protein
MNLLGFLPLLIASATAPAATAPSTEKPIIITGVSIRDTEKALRDCLARHCPPDEDIRATLAHAENLFVAGRYDEAIKTTRSSLHRNADQAKRYPEPVSDLYRADSRLASHLGEKNEYEQSTFGIKRALKAALPEQDVRVIGANFEIAAMQASVGRLDSAAKAYAQAEKDAIAIGRPDLAASARVRSAWLEELDGHRGEARRKLKAIAADDRPEARIARLTALVLLARLDRQEGKLQSSDALIGEMKGARLTQPVLLFAPPVSLKTVEIEGNQGSVTRLIATDNFEKRWIDVGFWVTPQGHVTDLEVLRSHGPTYWADSLLKSIAGRIYAPMASDSAGSYRVERYTYTSFWMDVTGTRIPQRSPNARIEYLDLTKDDSAG